MKNKIIFITISVFLIFLFTQCEENSTLTSDDDIDIDFLTIINVPAEIPIRNNPDAPKAITYKMILNATDSTENVQPKAKATVTLTNDMLQENGTYSIPVNLVEADPYPPAHNPNAERAPWKGTAKFFSITIYPYDSSEYGADAIWAKGAYVLDKQKDVVDWNEIINFRVKSFGFDSRADDIYEIIQQDDLVITKGGVKTE